MTDVHVYDSQITLTNPEPALELVLEKSATPMNTRLLVDGNPRWKISTVDRDAAITDVTDLRTNTIVSSFRRRTFFSDKVKFANRFGGKSVKKEEWMTEVKLATGHDAWLIQSESGRFLWRWDPVLRMVLTPENSPDEILAFVKDEPPVFALVVKHAAESYLDEIILVFSILEQRLRLDTKALRIADGWNADNRANMLGNTIQR